MRKQHQGQHQAYGGRIPTIPPRRYTTAACCCACRVHQRPRRYVSDGDKTITTRHHMLYTSHAVLPAPFKRSAPIMEASATDLEDHLPQMLAAAQQVVVRGNLLRAQQICVSTPHTHYRCTSVRMRCWMKSSRRSCKWHASATILCAQSTLQSSHSWTQWLPRPMLHVPRIHLPNLNPPSALHLTQTSLDTSLNTRKVTRRYTQLVIGTQKHTLQRGAAW